MARLKTGCPALDQLSEGGLITSATTAFFGVPKLGKTWLSNQMSYMATRPVTQGGLDAKVIYIDTEGEFIPEVQAQSGKFFKARWSDCKPQSILWKDTRELEDLGNYVGLHITITDSENRKDAKVVIDPAVDSPCFKEAKKEGVRLIVVDSVSNLVKAKIPWANQNAPARAAVLNPLMNRLLDLSKRLDAVVISTHHITKAPMNPRDMGKPWGGDYIIANNKYILQILTGLKDQRDLFGERVRRLKKFRWGLSDEIVDGYALVSLEHDYGYTNPNPVSLAGSSHRRDTSPVEDAQDA